MPTHMDHAAGRTTLLIAGTSPHVLHDEGVLVQPDEHDGSIRRVSNPEGPCVFFGATPDLWCGLFATTRMARLGLALLRATALAHERDGGDECKE